MHCFWRGIVPYYNRHREKARASEEGCGGFREGKRARHASTPACSACSHRLAPLGPGSAVPQFRAHAREHALFPAGERRGRGDEIVLACVLKTRTKP